MNKTLAATAAATFLACILLANYVTTEYGMVPVWPEPLLTATAGTYLAGLTFVLRDLIQDQLKIALTRTEVFTQTVGVPAYSAEHRAMAPQLQGLMRTEEKRVEVQVEPSRWIVTLPLLGLIALGAGLSYFVSDPFIALASGVAFLASELADLAIYTPLRKRGYIRAAVASNVVGAFVDTVLFLWIAGFPIADAIAGQMAGKTLVTGAVVLGVVAYRARRVVAA